MDWLHTLQETLSLRWNHRLPALLEKARNFALGHSNTKSIEKAIQEAYSAGYREGYWEGVVDVVECSSSSEKGSSAQIELVN